MMKGLLLCLFLVVVAVSAKSQWEEVERADPDVWVPIRFALKQRNLDVLESTLLDVSNPESKNYGKWWSRSAIFDLVAPPAEVSEKVATFLSRNGGRNVENRRDMIKLEMRVEDLEIVLQTILYRYAEIDGNRMIIRTRDGYIVPDEIAEYVEMVSGIAEFPVLSKPKTHENGPSKDAAPASGIITPQHLQLMYNIPAAYDVHPQNVLALIEFEDDSSFSPTDLSQFAKDMAVPNITVTKILGPYNYSNPDLESSLDVQYGGAIGINTSVWFWTIDTWMYEFATDLQNLTSPPLVASMSWGWPEPLQCQIDEGNCDSSQNPVTYVNRVNVEFQKVGLSGITLVAASGDQGAPGDGNAGCADPKKGNLTSPLSTIFPGASPWVLAVGATMLVDSVEETKVEANPPICSQYQCATATKEAVCTYPGALITSGGGFSNYSPRQSFQDAAVTAYLKSGVTLPPAGDFNSSNRGFPDVAALGHNYLVLGGGQYEQVDGTSCSSPVVAGIISLLNSYRLNNKKAPLGFIAPVIYAAWAKDPTTFTDITTGDNKCTEFCCAKVGYEATKGWDPVTGLGTPQFPKLLSYIQTLP